MSLSLAESSYLREFLKDNFNITELNDIAFVLGVDFKKFSQNKLEFILGLISYFENRKNIQCLLLEVNGRHPDDKIAQIIIQQEHCQPRKKCQISLPLETLSEKGTYLLLQELAKMLNVDREEIMILATKSARNVILFGLPAQAFAELKNRPIRIKNLLPDSQQYKLPSGNSEQKVLWSILEVTDFDALPEFDQKQWQLDAQERLFNNDFKEIDAINDKADATLEYKLINDLETVISSARFLAREFELAQDRASFLKLARFLEIVQSLARNLELARFLDHSNFLDRSRFLDREFALDLEIALEIASALELIQSFAFDHSNYRSYSIALEIVRFFRRALATHLEFVMGAVLERPLDLEQITAIANARTLARESELGHSLTSELELARDFQRENE